MARRGKILSKKESDQLKKARSEAEWLDDGMCEAMAADVDGYPAVKVTDVESEHASASPHIITAKQLLHKEDAKVPILGIKRPARPSLDSRPTFVSPLPTMPPTKRRRATDQKVSAKTVSAATCEASIRSKSSTAMLLQDATETITEVSAPGGDVQPTSGLSSVGQAPTGAITEVPAKAPSSSIPGGIKSQTPVEGLRISIPPHCVSDDGGDNTDSDDGPSPVMSVAPSSNPRETAATGEKLPNQQVIRQHQLALSAHSAGEPVCEQVADEPSLVAQRAAVASGRRSAFRDLIQPGVPAHCSSTAGKLSGAGMGAIGLRLDSAVNRLEAMLLEGAT